MHPYRTHLKAPSIHKTKRKSNKMSPFQASPRESVAIQFYSEMYRPKRSRHSRSEKDLISRRKDYPIIASRLSINAMNAAALWRAAAVEPIEKRTGFQRTWHAADEDGLARIQRQRGVQNEVGVRQLPRPDLNRFILIRTVTVKTNQQDINKPCFSYADLISLRIEIETLIAVSIRYGPVSIFRNALKRTLRWNLNTT